MAGTAKMALCMPQCYPLSMRRFSLMLFSSLVLWSCLTDVGASEFSGTATLTSEYIYRGLAKSDGDPAIQLGLDYAHDSGFFVGAWGSTIDLGGPTNQRDYELNFYAGYHYTFQAPFSAAVSLLRYTYPGQSGYRDYDYNELLLNATWLEHYSIELGYTDDLNGQNVSSHHWELQGDWPVDNAWVIGATLGRNDLSEAGASDYYYWDVGASARFSRVVVDLRWFDSENAGYYFYTASADSRFVVTLSIPF